jgi:hypothetical protein
MHIIAHRGNISGPEIERENSPEYLLLAIALGFDVEVDVWFSDKKWFLGHDSPAYQVGQNFFDAHMWLHCKNTQAIEQLQKTNLNWFWHESDIMTQTSKGHIWCYPENYIKNGITVHLGAPTQSYPELFGICTDYALLWRNHA